MAKSKNHTAHNQSYKAHRDDIKKPRKHRHTSTKGRRQFGGGSGGCW
ncbi:putative ribosomal protein L29e [Helianthus debilis subsp. tardiflorus]